MQTFKAVCPECRGKFPWEPTLGYPKSCPLCSFSIGHNRADDDIVLPFIRSSKMKATDDTYRQMEAASEQRAQQAAELAGVPVSEMSGLKITNLQDARHEGQVAAVPVSNPVTQFMEQTKVGGYQDGSGFAATVGTGYAPNEGAKMRTLLHSQHGERAGHGTTSDRPANETLQPGYRRRG